MSAAGYAFLMSFDDSFKDVDVVRAELALKKKLST